MRRKARSFPRDIRSGSDIVARLDGCVLKLKGNLTVQKTTAFTTGFFRFFHPPSHKRLLIDLSGLENIDSAGIMALFYIQKKLNEKKIHVEIEGGSPSVQDKIRLFFPESEARITLPHKPDWIESVGEKTRDFFADYIFGFLLLAANMCHWGVVDIFRPRSRRKGEFTNQAVLIGVNAVLIVIFLSFVIGYVIALHSAGQLRTFGANIFVVDLVVFSIMSQMGPLITAILVAGRSGSAIAAEIATMKVTAELDAIKTMGLNPIRFVVVPKLYACMLTMPFLIVFANLAGITGGLLAAQVYLDISPEVFINRMQEIMMSKDLYTALVKSQVYAGLIVLTGSFYGFRVERGAEGVGRMTTVAVVVSISLVILADSLLGVIFY